VTVLFEEYEIGPTMCVPGDRYRVGPIRDWVYDPMTGRLDVTWPTGLQERWSFTRHWEEGEVLFEGYACRDVGQKSLAVDRHIRLTGEPA
jgi:hypothetical protein